MDGKTIERSIWIDAPRERVWQAVSDPAQIGVWFAPGTIISFKDDRVSIRMGDQDVEVALVVTIDPPRELTTRSLPDMALTTSYLLEEENGGTRFRVVESGFENLPAEQRQARLEQDAGGWELALANLKAFINGEPLPHPEGF